ncbi:MAG: Rnase Y domain-containing protein [Candidatus Gracilibacteria bacterium]
MNIIIYIAIAIICTAAGIAGGYTQLYKHARIGIDKKKEKAAELLEITAKECAEIKEKAKQRTEETNQRVEEYIKTTEHLMQQMESSVNNKEIAIKKQEEKTNQLKLKLAEIEEETSAKKTQIKQSEKNQTLSLAAKSGKTEQEIRKEIINRYEKELREENAPQLQMLTDQCREKAQRLAQNVIISAIQRLCSPTSVEPRSIYIKVPKDITKGKIVGKDAQNILHFEELLDVDVVFNDLPQTISISAFNLVNRRIAQKALEHLVDEKGEIDKTKIKHAVDKSKQEVDKELFEIGKNMVDKVGLRDFDPELIRTIGRLQFRTSYSQNIMRHSMEVGYLATMMGSEIGLDIKVCKVAGFLHDLGKAIDQNPDVQGTHDFLTKELMEKYKFSKEEIHAAWTHHESEKPQTPEALIVQAADALSASRPGARQESLEKYLERLRALEDTAASFEGVRKSFAISAGREIRAIVDAAIVEDSKTQELAEKIAAKIEHDLTYPGKIKVNVIRKTKTIEVAK